MLYFLVGTRADGKQKLMAAETGQDSFVSERTAKLIRDRLRSQVKPGRKPRGDRPAIAVKVDVCAFDSKVECVQAISQHNTGLKGTDGRA